MQIIFFAGRKSFPHRCRSVKLFFFFFWPNLSFFVVGATTCSVSHFPPVGLVVSILTTKILCQSVIGRDAKSLAVVVVGIHVSIFFK